MNGSEGASKNVVKTSRGSFVVNSNCKSDSSNCSISLVPVMSSSLEKVSTSNLGPVSSNNLVPANSSISIFPVMSSRLEPVIINRSICLGSTLAPAISDSSISLSSTLSPVMSGTSISLGSTLAPAISDNSLSLGPVLNGSLGSENSGDQNPADSIIILTEGIPTPTIHHSSEKPPYSLSTIQSGGLSTESKEGLLHLVVDKAGNLYEYLKCDIIENPSDDKNHCYTSALDQSAINHSISLDEKELEGELLKEDTVDKSIQKSTLNCFECGKIFESAKDWRRHSASHTGEKPHSCQYCCQTFSTHSSRACHIRTIHEKTQEYVCPECLKVFNQRSNMTKHYKSIHLEMLSVECDICQRKFSQNSALTRHIKSQKAQRRNSFQNTWTSLQLLRVCRGTSGHSQNSC